MAAILGDAPLAQEAAVRAYHLLAPLLALSRPPACLVKPLSQLLLCLQPAASPAVGGALTAGMAGQQLQEQQNSATRVAAAAACHLLHLARREGEQQLGKQIAGLDVPLLQGALSTADAMLPEASALRDAVLLLPPEAAAAPPGTRGGSDLVAAMLPLLAAADPLDACWPLLSAASAQGHTRWLEMCVRAVEAAVRAQATSAVQHAVQLVSDHVRRALKVPHVGAAGARWRLAEAAAAVQVQLAEEQLPPKPDLQGLSDEQAQQAQHAWQQQCAERILQVCRRLLQGTGNASISQHVLGRCPRCLCWCTSMTQLCPWRSAGAAAHSGRAAAAAAPASPAGAQAGG